MGGNSRCHKTQICGGQIGTESCHYYDNFGNVIKLTITTNSYDSKCKLVKTETEEYNM